MYRMKCVLVLVLGAVALGGCAGVAAQIEAADKGILEPAVDRTADLVLDKALCNRPPDVHLRAVRRHGPDHFRGAALLCPQTWGQLNGMAVEGAIEGAVAGAIGAMNDRLDNLGVEIGPARPGP